MSRYALGLDYGTNSVRALLVDVADGGELAVAVWNYEHGRNGVVLASDPDLARQHPADYVKGAELTIKQVLRAAAKANRKFRPEHVIGIGVDATGSTPLPVDSSGIPLALDRRFANEPAAMAWLWKDHTSSQEAIEITQHALAHRPQYLARCGGTYSSEWFFSKILHCKRKHPKVFRAAHTWVELADWLPAMLMETQSFDKLKIGACAAGHKAMFNPQWGGYPDAEFLAGLDRDLAAMRDRLATEAYPIGTALGGLSESWARRTGLPAGIPVSAGALDAHAGAVGAGIRPGMLVKIIGTSSCDIMVHPAGENLPDIPGLCGMVNASVLPGFWGLEAGQSAVGDIFNWFVNYVQPRGPKAGSHEALTAEAAKLAPGESGLLALDWNNGNRTVLVDQRLTGLLLGQTIYTTPAEIYSALVEATAFGALTIINRLEGYGVKVRQIVNCGGIAEKNPLVMQIYADVTGRVMKVSRSPQACALGSAIAGAVAAGKARGGYNSFAAAQKAMTGVKPVEYRSRPKAHKVYSDLYALYKKLHDCFGVKDCRESQFDVMKRLLDIRNAARNSK